MSGATSIGARHSLAVFVRSPFFPRSVVRSTQRTSVSSLVSVGAASHSENCFKNPECPRTAVTSL